LTDSKFREFTTMQTSKILRLLASVCVFNLAGAHLAHAQATTPDCAATPDFSDKIRLPIGYKTAEVTVTFTKDAPDLIVWVNGQCAAASKTPWKIQVPISAEMKRLDIGISSSLPAPNCKLRNRNGAVALTTEDFVEDCPRSHLTSLARVAVAPASPH
jgi:hypothetical protein